MSEQAITPIEEQSVNFQGDELSAALIEGDRICVPIKPICDYLGVNWSSQRKRITRDEVLSEASTMVIMTTVDDRHRPMLCLPLEYLNGWLFGLTTSRVKEELQSKLIQYKKECYVILFDAFRKTAIAPVESSSELVAIRDMGLAIARMAEQQIEMETRITTNETRLDKAAQVVGELGRRVTTIEQKLSPAQAINDEQAADISQKVKAIAQALSQKDSTKNHYQSVFGELYRRFRVSSYKAIRQEQYQAVLNFLDEWIDDIE